MSRSIVCGVFALLVAAASAAVAQGAYPNRPITLIVPFAAGGTSDVIARVAAEELGKALGARFVIENIGGAGGTLALARAARAAPDGYTIVIGNTGTNAASYHIHSDIRYAPESFAPIGMVAKTSPMIALRKDFPAADFKGFLAHVRANPGRVTLGHAGVGSSNYLICLAFIAAARADVTLVSYRGAALALTDALAGQSDGVCDTATAVSNTVLAGALKGVVVATPERVALLPDVPTSAEAGLPAFRAQGWNALFAPAGTPEPIIARLNAALREALASEALQTRFRDLATAMPTPEELTPEFLARFVPVEIDRYRELLKDAPRAN